MNRYREAILLIERTGKKTIVFAPALERKHFTVKVVKTGQQALNEAVGLKPALVILNAASLGSNGLRICNRLSEQLADIPLIHVLGENSEASAKSSPADVTLVMPFTPRKLINRVRRLLPGQHKDTMIIGPISFSPKARIVEAHGREKRLTPRAARLLEVFIDQPGRVLERSFLMREVWQTDYVGDTRTLDVHVRWVREAVELEPAKPRHVVTVRGKGYRFDPIPLKQSRKRKSSKKSKKNKKK